MEMLTKVLNKLKAFTIGCREDMHEPDEQNISADIIGNKLDNAMGEVVIGAAIEDGWQEYIVILRKEGGQKELFNLADLIALARKAKI